MQHSQEKSAEVAMQQLVRAVVGRDDETSISLARRVLGSQIGGASYDGDRKHTDLSSIWRRISRKEGKRCSTDVKRLYDQFEHRAMNNNMTDNSMPPRLLVVLSKLMGNNKFVQSHVPFHSAAAAAAVPTMTTTKTSSAVGINISKPFQTTSTSLQTRQEEIALAEEESLLLRECLYALQGIDGERIRYFRKKDSESKMDAVDEYEGIRVQSPAVTNSLLYTGRVAQSRIGSGAVDALRISGEAGWLYIRIQTYITAVQNNESKGVVARAFAGALANQLREYHNLLTQYEAKLSELTLRQLMIELRMPTSRLKILAMLTDGVGHLSGGHLLSALYKHSLHGDTRHANLVESLLYAACRPWFDILYIWSTQGVLSDPRGEFFVVEMAGVDDKNLWREQYRINKDQVPIGVLERDLVGPAFVVGKGINFIRRCLLDGKWTMELRTHVPDDETASGSIKELGYYYKPYSHEHEKNSELYQTLTDAADLVHSHILRALRQNHYMMEHLFAMKQFLFLGQGDFFSALMDGLHSEFQGRQGIAGIYKHTILAIVEGALRSTNAKYMPSYVVDRLQVELLLDEDDESLYMFGPGRPELQRKVDNRSVWDIFMLGYQVPDPLVAIVHQDATDKYKIVFSLLFSLKKVEYMLNYTYRQGANLRRALQTAAHYNGINLSTSQGYAQAVVLLRRISITRQSMTHLVVNLKSYLMFEVLEGGWKRLVLEIEASKTLDEVIEAHDFYLNGIVRKCLLRTATTTASSSSNGGDESSRPQLTEQVQFLLNLTDDFCNLQETLFQQALRAAEAASEKRREAERRMTQGHWGFESEQDILEEESFFGLANMNVLQEVIRMGDEFNENNRELLRMLGEKVNGNHHHDEAATKAHPENTTATDDDISEFKIPTSRRFVYHDDDDLDQQRFLACQLDHNNYYGTNPA